MRYAAERGRVQQHTVALRRRSGDAAPVIATNSSITPAATAQRASPSPSRPSMKPDATAPVRIPNHRPSRRTETLRPEPSTNSTKPPATRPDSGTNHRRLRRAGTQTAPPASQTVARADGTGRKPHPTANARPTPKQRGGHAPRHGRPVFPCPLALTNGRCEAFRYNP